MNLFLTVLEVRSLSSRCYQGWSQMEPLPVLQRASCLLTGCSQDLSSVVMGRGRERPLVFHPLLIRIPVLPDSGLSFNLI